VAGRTGLVGWLRNRTSRLMFWATAARKNCSRITSVRITVLLFVIVLSGLASYIGRGIVEIVFR
jgi:hypothetical protein